MNQHNEIIRMIKRASDDSLDKSFQTKRKMLDCYTKDELFRNMVGSSEKNKTLTRINYLNAISHIPTEVVAFVDERIKSGKKVFTVKTAMKEIVHIMNSKRNILNSGPIERIEKQTNASKRVVMGTKPPTKLSDQEKAKIMALDKEKEALIDTANSCDVFLSNSDVLHNKYDTYRMIYDFLEIAHNNIVLYKDRVDAQSLLKYLHPKYKKLEIAKDDIQVSLQGGGIIVFALSNALMKKFNAIDRNSTNRHGYNSKDKVGGLWHNYVVYNTSKGVDLDSALSANPTNRLLEHELLHSYTEIYTSTEDRGSASMILPQLYTSAKKEILSKIQNNDTVSSIIADLQLPAYDYLTKDIVSNKKLLKLINLSISINKKGLDSFNKLGSSSVTASMLQNMTSILNNMQFQYDIFTKPEARDQVKQQYYKDIKVYTEQAFMFCRRAKKTKAIYDPFVILARYPMSKWHELEELTRNGLI